VPAPTAIPASLRARPFTLTEARAAGLTDRMLRGRRFRRVFAYVYVCADVPDTPLIRLAAAMLRAPHAFATDLTAAHVLGVPVPDDPLTYLGIRRGDPRIQSAGIRIREYARPPPTIRHGDYVVTSPTQVFVQLVDRLPLLDLVIAGDALVRRGHTSLDALREAADQVRGRRGVRARSAARSVRARVDSPMETPLRLLIVHAGLPERETNRDVISSHGGWLACPDLSYPEWKIAIEYDGDHHRVDSRQWRRDIARRENLEADGWIVLVITAVDVFRRPAPTLMRIVSALDRRGCPGLPLRLEDDWRRL
jgi:very-short-patch-repair endonuclease